jgi:CDP-glucose 4,6-dehydratase
LEDLVVISSLPDFYKGKRTLITGHTGFKGGWLAIWLKMMGSRVTGIALPPEPARPSLFESAKVQQGMNSNLTDIRDFDAVRQIFRQHKPEIVFHMAAQALVRRSYRDPMETYASNVMGTVHVLEAARSIASVRAIVVVTSDKCYENREWVWGYREQDPLGGYDPYSSSKACTEIVAAAYRRSFFDETGKTLLASARAGNVFGGGDWSEDRLVPDLMRGITSKTKIAIRQPDARRPWQHVLEPLHGYLLLARRLWQGERQFAEAWNFGPQDDSLRVSDLAKRIIELWGQGRLALRKNKARMHEAHQLRLDCSKAREVLGWRTYLSTEEGLRLTVDWYRNFEKEPRRALQLTCNQISQYLDRIC